MFPLVEIRLNHDIISVKFLFLSSIKISENHSIFIDLDP